MTLDELSYEQIKALPAGAELDALIWKHVFGMQNWLFIYAPYSTETDGAGHVIDYLTGQDYEFALQTWGAPGVWCVVCTDPNGHDTGGHVGPLPLAVCRAALHAVKGYKPRED